MKSSLRISLVLVSFVTLAGLLTGCQPHPPKPGQMIDMAAGHIKGQLNLTDAQNAKLQDLVAAAKDLAQKHSEAEDPVRAQAEALILAPTLDTDQVRTLIHDREVAFQKDFDVALDTLLPKLAAFTDSLTPDQKKKVVEFLDKMGQRWDKR